MHAGSPMMAYRFHDAAAAALEGVSDGLQMLWADHRQQRLVQPHLLFPPHHCFIGQEMTSILSSHVLWPCNLIIM